MRTSSCALEYDSIHQWSGDLRHLSLDLGRAETLSSKMICKPEQYAIVPTENSVRTGFLVNQDERLGEN
jgi:hypothetical protein